VSGSGGEAPQAYEVTRPGLSPIGTRRAPTKLAEELALTIEREVLDAGWPVGTILGSESELLARHGVSRAILREAVRITEYLGFAEMRRGPGGGLVVTSPGLSAVMTAVTVYATFRDVGVAEVMAARRPLEELAAQQAAKRRTPSDVNELWARLTLELSEDRSDHWALHDQLAAISGNPAIELFVEVLSRLTGQYRVTSRMEPQDGRKRRHEGAVAHRGIVEAVAKGDADLAGRRTRVHLDAVEAALVAGDPERTIVLGKGDGDHEKRSTSVARRILDNIVGQGWQVGRLLGSELELQQRYGTGRSVLREALRLLEYHHVIRTRRGPGGGIIVAAPDEEATMEAMAVYLEARSITAQQLLEVREALELAIVVDAAAKPRSSDVDALLAVLEQEERAPAREIGVMGHLLHRRLAELSGNDALLLFVHVLTRLTEFRQLSPGRGFQLTYEEAAGAVARAHRAIVRAIAAGDVELARRRMQVHLRALPGHLR
jgi:DNA-binding FadR family transcriptional regulator